MWLYWNKKYPFSKFFLLIKLFLNDCTMESLIKQQYKLSRECGIPPWESDLMPDFEREVYLNYLLKDKKEEKQNNK